MERNNFRLSYWISRVTLNKCVYYVIWDQLVFSSWKRLPNSIFTKKILKKKKKNTKNTIHIYYTIQIYS